MATAFPSTSPWRRPAGNGRTDQRGGVSDDKKAEKPGAEKPVRLRPRAPCPICGKPSVQRYHPFCSVRCADVDLGRWLGGRYAIPASDPAEEDEEADSPDPSSTHPIPHGRREP
ncbi:MAG TPA: DNA gyrase inhibitor YacG [Aestuariivirgaceae bacterium]|nr:DNA gyrase inhibitor YacG [Aestuariivirgaceae bacterium]